jgi:hypothetical protein
MKLTQFEGRWAEAAIGAIFPGSREDGFADIRAMDVPGFLQRVMRTVPLQAAFGLRVAIWLVALAPLLVIGRFATIAGLALPDREKVVARLVSSRAYVIRSLVMILKTMGALLYAGDDGVRARMQRPALPQATALIRTKRIHAASGPSGVLG